MAGLEIIMNTTFRYIFCLDKYQKPQIKDIVSAFISGVIFEGFILGFWLFDLIQDRMFINLVGTIVWVMILNACNLGIWTLGWRHLVLLFLYCFLWQQVYTAILY